jgi:hypothetical protein
VYQGRVQPERFEVHRHCDQPFADSLIENNPIMLPGLLALFACLG